MMALSCYVYAYEPSEILHDAVNIPDDTAYLLICNGVVLCFDEKGFTRYTNFAVMEELRWRQPMPARAAAA